MAPRANDDRADDEWRFSLADLDDDPDGDDPDGDDAADAGGSIFGPRPDDGVLEVVPGDPKLENVLFVLLGVATSVLLVADLVGLV